MSQSRQLAPQLELFTPLTQDPGFVVRESGRAKRLSIQVHAQGRVEVVVPRRTSARRVKAFVGANREWIDRALATLAEEYPAQEFALPNEIDLAAIESCFSVRYQAKARVDVKAKAYGSNVVVEGDVSNESLCRDTLKAWVKLQGRNHLVPWLARVAQETGLSYRRVQIRGQSTRWGSCSASGTVSLNYGLLFVEPALVRYLLVHELCHTVHLNHSRRFWSLVGKHVPDYQRLDRRLDESWRKVPGWARL